MPKISILIPVYNRELHIGPCIQSALNQTIKDIEVIVVDNASTDRTWEICKEYARNDSRVRIFQNKENIGPVKNWKRCIEEASGEYAKILFSDDLMAPDFLQKTLPLLEAQEVGFVYTTALIGEQPDRGKQAYIFAERTGIFNSMDFIERAFFGKNTPVSPGCAIFRTEDLRGNLMVDIPSPTIQDFARHGAGPDLLMYLLTAAKYPKFGFVAEPLSFFRSHEGSITISDKERYLQRCYDQAKVWFARSYMKSEMVRNLYVHIYIRSRKMQSLRATSETILDDYCDEKIRLSFWELMVGHLRKGYQNIIVRYGK
jgi:glycosyltransferase involved in cell wall biosynthesis